MADGTDGLVAGVQAAELGQVGGGVGEGPASAGQAQELAGMRADQANEAEAIIERIAGQAAAGADEVKA